MYSYEKERHTVFMEKNQGLYIKIRENAFNLIGSSGCAKLGKIISGHATGDSFTQLACVDRLVEIGELKEIEYGQCSTQNKIYIIGRRI